MAVEVATSTFFSLGSLGSLTTEVDRSTYFTSIGFPLEQAEVETTAFGNSGLRSYLPGLKGATFSVDGNWDSTIDGHLFDLWNASGVLGVAEWIFGPLGNTSGYVKYSGSLFVQTYEITPSVGEPEHFTASMRITTAVTRGTFA